MNKHYISISQSFRDHIITLVEKARSDAERIESPGIVREITTSLEKLTAGSPSLEEISSVIRGVRGLLVQHWDFLESNTGREILKLTDEMKDKYLF